MVQLCEGFATSASCGQCQLTIKTNNIILLPLANLIDILHNVTGNAMESTGASVISTDKSVFNCAGDIVHWTGQDVLGHSLVERGPRYDFECNRNMVHDVIHTWREISRDITSRDKYVILLTECIDSLPRCSNYKELLLELKHIHLSAALIESEFTVKEEVHDAVIIGLQRRHEEHMLGLGCTSLTEDYTDKSCGKCLFRLDDYDRLFEMYLPMIYEICGKMCSVCTEPNNIIDIDNSRLCCSGAINISYKILPDSEHDTQDNIGKALTWNRNAILQIILRCSAYTHDPEVRDFQSRTVRMLNCNSMLAMRTYFVTSSRSLAAIMIW